MMKFKFDAKQQFQLDAIYAVVSLFEGQSLSKGSYELTMHDKYEVFDLSQVQTHLGIGNNLELDDEVLNNNLKIIQKQNNIHQEDSIKTKGRNFAIEMETGTGKTYVYLRTCFELNKQYGFKKFIIVVPSVAIREGVLKSIELMKEHFKELYSNLPFNHIVYNSKRVNELRSFATANELQIMIINIDSFNKKESNIIHDVRDKLNGRKPIDYVRATNPIVIMDEPQNMESDTAKKAIESLNPICTLRYSATHRDKYNLIYQLDPIKAFQMKLVKRISVAPVLAENDANAAFIKVNSISNRNGRFSANLTIHKQTPDGSKATKMTVKKDDDLFIKSNEREIYRNGFIVDEINARPSMEYIKFSNGIRISIGEERGGVRKEVVREQIKQTIKAHLDKEVQVQDTGIKVLSLFFIDKVSNYRLYTDSGYEKGVYAQWFEEEYKALVDSQEYASLFKKHVPVDKVHNGYFSMDKKGGKEHYVDTTGNTVKDDDTYNRIMKDKEKLLSLEDPLKFIFSHSALREGWDNPNVFQICTLSNTTSKIKKRQEIGRGMRLPVNQLGERVSDEYINNLVVVANESYEEFAATLQKEFEEECGIVFGRLPIEAFVGLVYSSDDKKVVVDKEMSEKIWDNIKKQNLIEPDGFIKKEFNESIENNTFNVPKEFEQLKSEIIKSVEKYQIERHITKHNPVRGQLNEKVLIDPEFEKFWNAINTKTIYSVNYSTEELIEKTSKAIMKLGKIDPPKIKTSMADIEMTTKGVKANLVRTPSSAYVTKYKRLPDILTYIQSRVELTRRTIYDILKQSKRMQDFSVNPQLFMDSVVKEIQSVLNQMIVEGIKYERLEGIMYEMSRLRDDAHKLNFSKDRIVPTTKSIHDYIVYDSGVEKKFAEGLERLRDVKFFIKLPGWFKVDTPVGSYNPDWAILKYNGEIVYLIRETKSTRDQLQLRGLESAKIKCGSRHFETIGIDYDIVTTADEI
ncbi:MAG: DEAD/DEAH box helicase family protein [Endomicrobiales bacterium]|nr:DEAD/DEAH box helicase family protein [Endomicrobiales bacterium]